MIFPTTVLPTAIEALKKELVFEIERLGKEPPPSDEVTRQIEMAPELIDLHGEALILQ